MAMLKEMHTEACRLFDRITESVKLSEPMQNKFLETIIGITSDLDATFLIANAQMKSNFPIIYCSEAFSEDTGFPRYEVTRHDVFLEFLRGRQTPLQSFQEYEESVNNIKQCQVELLLYANKGYKQWYLVSLFPVKKDCDGTIGFFLILFNCISHLKPAIKDSPKRNWKKAVKRILNKPTIEQLRKKIDCGAKTKKMRKSDMETIRHKITNCFVPEYGGENFQVPGYLIKHFSICKVLWDTMVVILILYTAFAMPFLMCFNLTNIYMTYIDIVIDLLFIIDLILNFFTTYVDDKGELVTIPKKIRMYYLKGWFTIDCVAAIPYLTYFIIMHMMGQETGKIGKIIIIKLARLLRMAKVRKKIHNVMQLSSVTLLVWVGAFTIIGHWMACVWYALARYIDNPCTDTHGWLHTLSVITKEYYNCTIEKGVMEPNDGSGPSKTSAYFSAMYYTLSSLTTCGFGNIAPNTICEKVFGCLTMLGGCVLYAFIFGQVTNIISQMQKNSNEFNEQMDDIRSFNGIYKVPHNVGKRLEDYFRSTWAVTKGTNEEEILKICPRDLQSDLCLHIHSRIFESNKGFKKLTKTSLRAISRYLCTIRTATGDKVVCFGEYVDTIYFVATGALEVKSGSNIMGLIGPGDAFGQRLGYLEHYGKSLFDVEACSFGTIHCITRDHLREALALFPEEYEKIRYGLVLSLDITRQIRVRKNAAQDISPKSESPIPTRVRQPSLSEDRYQRASEVLYVNSDGQTGLDYHETCDVLTGMSELKGELRRETERMNSKMGVVEAQMRLVLKLLRRQYKINDLDPEIGLQLNELMTHGQTLDDCNVEWSVADASGWKVDHYKNSHSNDGYYDDSDNELGISSSNSLRSVKSRNDIKLINVRKYSGDEELQEGVEMVEIDDEFEEDFKTSMKM